MRVTRSGKKSQYPVRVPFDMPPALQDVCVIVVIIQNAEDEDGGCRTKERNPSFLSTSEPKSPIIIIMILAAG